MNRLIVIGLTLTGTAAAAAAAGLITLSRWFAEAIEDGIEDST